MVSVELLSADSEPYLDEEGDLLRNVDDTLEEIDAVISADNLLQSYSLSSANPGMFIEFIINSNRYLYRKKKKTYQMYRN